MARPTKKVKTAPSTSANNPRSLSPAPPAAAARSSNYTIDEDIWLCRAFVKASLNAKAGVGMKRDTFWSNIKNDFDAIQAIEREEDDHNSGVIELKNKTVFINDLGEKLLLKSNDFWPFVSPTKKIVEKIRRLTMQGF
jgi:hypothetical protein